PDPNNRPSMTPESDRISRGNTTNNGISELANHRQAQWWLAGCTSMAIALAFLFPDSYQQDGGYHFLFARWAWVHPELLVGVWSRPAFTLLYSLPAQFGYPAAKLFTVAICAACAWHTWKLAKDLGFSRPELAIP